MDESRGPHQTWVGPQPASTETLPVPPPSHTNYAPRPNLASPGERVVLDATELSIFFQCLLSRCCSVTTLVQIKVDVVNILIKNSKTYEL